MEASMLVRAAKLWNRGLTAAEIAAALGLPSKAAVHMMASRNRALFPPRDKAFCGARTRQAARLAAETAGGWTEDLVARAETYWKEGRSASEIALRLGVSRCAVGGLIHRKRDRFPKRGSPYIRTPSVAAKAAKGPGNSIDTSRHPSRFAGLDDIAQPALPGPASKLYRHRDRPVEGSRPTPFSALGAFQCRWSLVDHDDPSSADMPCCGAHAGTGAYCTAHARLSAGAGTRSERDAEETLLRVGRR